MISGVGKETKKIENYFVKQLKNGISVDYYKNKYVQAKELFSKRSISKDKYEEVEDAYNKKKNLAQSINDLVSTITDLVKQQLFIKNDDIHKTYFESFLYYGDESLLSQYALINKDLGKKIDVEKEKFVELLDKNAKKICLEKKRFHVSGLTVTNLNDYKKIFKDGYEYIDSYIKSIADTMSLYSDENLLCVKDTEKNTKIFQLYSYSLCDEITFIRVLERDKKERNRLVRLRKKYMKLAESNLRWLYLNKALYFLNNNSIYDNLKKSIQDSILDKKLEIDKLSFKNFKSYNRLKISKKISKFDKKAIDSEKLEELVIICNEFIKQLDKKDYELENGYYYKYYQKINRQKKLLESELDLIEIPNYIYYKNKDIFDIEFLKEKYREFYLINDDIDCTEENFNIYIDKYLNKKEKHSKELLLDKDKYIDVNGYNLYEEPLKSFESVIEDFKEFSSIELTESLIWMREFLLKQYESLIVKDNYNLTFYEFLKENSKVVKDEIIEYEKDVELFCSMLYEIYLEYNVKEEFSKFAKKKGLNYVPIQYIKPELFDFDRRKKDIDRFKKEDEEELQKMISEALSNMNNN